MSARQYGSWGEDDGGNGGKRGKIRKECMVSRKKELVVVLSFILILLFSKSSLAIDPLHDKVGRVNPLKAILKDPLEERFPSLTINGFLENESNTRITNHNKRIGSNYPYLPFDEEAPTLLRSAWLLELESTYRFSSRVLATAILNFQYDASWDWDHGNISTDRYYTDPLTGKRAAYFAGGDVERERKILPNHRGNTKRALFGYLPK